MSAWDAEPGALETAWTAEETTEAMRSAALDVALGHDDDDAAREGLVDQIGRDLSHAESEMWPGMITEARQALAMREPGDVLGALS